MSGGYDAFDDPYAYKNTDVLKNKAGLRDAGLLEAFEFEMPALRADEPLPAGRYGSTHYRAIHRHLFQDVYRWAGRYRSVRTAKGGSAFCYPEHIAENMNRLFDRLQAGPFTGGVTFQEFAVAATDFLAELNAIHPFREGNGRVQLTFLHMIAPRAGHLLDMRRVEQATMIPAIVASFHGDLGPLRKVLQAHLQDPSQRPAPAYGPWRVMLNAALRVAAGEGVTPLGHSELDRR